MPGSRNKVGARRVREEARGQDDEILRIIMGVSGHFESHQRMQFATSSQQYCSSHIRLFTRGNVRRPACDTRPLRDRILCARVKRKQSDQSYSMLLECVWRHYLLGNQLAGLHNLLLGAPAASRQLKTLAACESTAKLSVWLTCF